MPSLNGLSDTLEPGVSGENTATGGIGVRGHAHVNGAGVEGYSTSGPGVVARSDNNIGIRASGANHAGFFEGNVTVSNTNGSAIDAISSGGPAIRAISPGVAGRFEGNVVITGDVILTGADCAEEFDIAEKTTIEPGTVMVLDQDGALHQSQHPYDKRVAGVISGAGSYKPGLILDRQQAQNNRLPIALMGKVFCKVDATYAPIDVGDLLTTSPTPGHAMKADDPFKAFGSVIGKALRPLEEGQSLIPILIALQ